MIKLDENYTIDSDSCNWILRYEYTCIECGNIISQEPDYE